MVAVFHGLAGLINCVLHLSCSADLEVFHKVLSKYCPERLHFSYPSMKCRTMLAVLDWNQTLREGRQQADTAAGQPSHIFMVF